MYNFRSLAPMVWDLWWFKDLEEKDDSLIISELITDDRDCRTALATPGLLNSHHTNFGFLSAP